jgi:hypothetical protein
LIYASRIIGLVVACLFAAPITMPAYAANTQKIILAKDQHVPIPTPFPNDPDAAKPSPLPVSGPDIDEIACKNGVKEVSLSASGVTVGDPAYIEFRSRLSAVIPSGHMYVVFGRLGADGKPLTSHIMGLYPKGFLLGMYGGAIAWVPANVKAFDTECSGLAVLDAWRVSMSEAQYQLILNKARAYLAKPPLWNMFGFNCNHFASSFGDLLGLRPPSNFALPAFAYLPAYIKANPGKAQ